MSNRERNGAESAVARQRVSGDFYQQGQMAETYHYQLHCQRCGSSIPSLGRWIDQGQGCGDCGERDATVRYQNLARALRSAIGTDRAAPGHTTTGLWRYRQVLPVDPKTSPVTFGEGGVPLERSEFLESYAAKLGIGCHVYLHRHDLSSGTSTFKDLSASMLATVLRDHGVQDFVAATTGNFGVAVARYLAEAGIRFWAFLPSSPPASYEEAIRDFGQQVIRHAGDYAAAQVAAQKLATSRGYLMSLGGLDPMRIEAKKTMAFEWYRQLGRAPTVYVQALSGGTGPLAISKGIAELVEAFGVQRPRMYMIQSDGCAPMAMAWGEAKQRDFASGWLHRYPVLENPKTEITTLLTGNPKLFPRVGHAVHRSGGEILSVPEKLGGTVAGALRLRSELRIGPASSIAVKGFLHMLHRQQVREGDEIVIAIGDSDSHATPHWRQSVLQFLGHGQPAGFNEPLAGTQRAN